MAKSVLDQFASDPEELRLFQHDRLIVAVTELICEEMKKRGCKRSELASALGKSKSYVSQCLDGERNLTLRTIADMLTALGLRMTVSAEPMYAMRAEADSPTRDDEPSGAASLPTPSS